MELRQLSHFLAVAETRHFTRAAARVHLTQSSLSSSIRSLERELGTDLFVRSTHRVELTEAGRALMPPAARAVAATEEAHDAVAGVRGVVRGLLTLGAIQTVGLLDLPALLARYRRRHPAVRLRLRHAAASALVRGTAEGELDLAVVDRPLGPQADRVAAAPLGSESLSLAVAASDPLAARRRPVRLGDLDGRDFVEYRADSALRRSIDQACEEAGLRRDVVAEIDSIVELVELVAGGVGVSLLPRGALAIAAGRVVGIATEPAIARELVLVSPRDRDPSPAAAAFVELLRDGGRDEADPSAGDLVGLLRTPPR